MIRSNTITFSGMICSIEFVFTEYTTDVGAGEGWRRSVGPIM